MAPLDRRGVVKVKQTAHLVDLSGWSLSIEPRAEWRQMFREAWRLERDYFYDRGMHGVDWPAMLEKYLPHVRVEGMNALRPDTTAASSCPKRRSS